MNPQPPVRPARDNSNHNEQILDINIIMLHRFKWPFFLQTLP